MTGPLAPVAQRFAVQVYKTENAPTRIPSQSFRNPAKGIQMFLQNIGRRKKNRVVAPEDMIRSYLYRITAGKNQRLH